MASLISDTEKANLVTIFDDIFDTFKRDIVIFKESKKVLDNIITNENYAGYGESSNKTNYTYVANSGVYPAHISYQDKQDAPFVNSIASTDAKGIARIKVKKDAREFIRNGKTEYIQFDDKKFNIITTDSVKKFLGNEYYVYYLETTS